MSCPRIDEEKVQQFMIKIGKEGEDDLNGLTICSDSDSEVKVGGRRKKQRGGNLRNIIRGCLYAILAVLIGIAVGGAGAQTVEQGLRMLVNGQCTSVSSLLWGYIGLANPICRVYTHILTACALAMAGNAQAIAELTGIIAGTIATPALISNSIDRIAGLISGNVETQLAIEGAPDRKMLEEEGNKSKGGRRRTRRRRTNSRRGKSKRGKSKRR